MAVFVMAEVEVAEEVDLQLQKLASLKSLLFQQCGQYIFGVGQVQEWRRLLTSLSEGRARIFCLCFG
jgi:hypothetical protein